MEGPQGELSDWVLKKARKRNWQGRTCRNPRMVRKARGKRSRTETFGSSNTMSDVSANSVSGYALASPRNVIRKANNRRNDSSSSSLGETFSEEVAARPMFLIQYIRPLPPGTPHPNSASGLTALLVCVSDMEKAAAAYREIGQVIDREIPMPEFGAAAKQVALKSGSIVLLRATDSAGPTARRLKEQGEGILGVRIGVTDLGQARSFVGNKNISAKGPPVLVLPENAAGVWLQFQPPGQ